MNEPRYVRPESVAQAIAALAAANGDGVIVAGGTVIGALFNQRLASPSVLVDITRVGALKAVTSGSEGLAIGSLVTHDEVLRSPRIRAAAPLLSEIAEDISCPRLRNKGTLGGSICTVGSQGDPATGLIALGATIRIRGNAGVREVPLEDFYNDAFKVDLAPDEIVEAIRVPPMKQGARFGYCKHGPRNAMDFTQITTAVVCSPREGGGYLTCIGMNGVGSAPNRPRATESLLAGADPAAVDWSMVERTLSGEIEPQGDLVYSEQFKRHLGLVTLRRAFERAMSRPGFSGGINR